MMDTLEYKITYRRFLPHIQPPGATLFITYRLFGSIPAAALEQLAVEAEQVERILACIQNPQERAERSYLEQRRMFGKWDAVLDAAATGPRYLADDQIAGLVADSLHYLHKRVYNLDTFSIMSNHAHILFTPLLKDEKTYHSISSIMHSHKRHTAREANRVLGKEGQFWQHESYDHAVRNEGELERIRRYIINNPVKAGLVEKWTDYKWTFCNTLSNTSF